MNKHLFVIFLSILSSGLCASETSPYVDYPGQGGLVRPMSPQKNVSFSQDDAVYWSQVPSQSSSNGSTPESERRAAINALALASKNRVEQSQQQ